MRLTARPVRAPGADRDPVPHARGRRCTSSSSTASWATTSGRPASSIRSWDRRSRSAADLVERGRRLDPDEGRRRRRARGPRWRGRKPTRIGEATRAIRERLARGGKLILFGNGGSATDANDWAHRLRRAARRAIGRSRPSRCRMEPANVTAIANDVGTDVIFLRQLIAHARPEDVAVGDLHQRRLAQHHCGAGGGAEAQAPDRRAARLRRRRDRAPGPGRLLHRRAVRLHPADSGSPGVDLPRHPRGLEALGLWPALSCIGTASCPYTRDLREWLEMRRTEFIEYDVESDPAARAAHAGARGAASAPCRSWSRTARWSRSAGRDAGARSGSEPLDDDRLLDPRSRRGPGRRLPAVRVPPRPRQHARRLGAERGRGRRDPRRRHGGRLDAFLRDLRTQAPPAAAITGDRRRRAEPGGPGRSSPSGPASSADQPPRRASRPTCPSATAVSPSCSTPTTRASATRTSTAPTAALATRSFTALPYDRAGTTMAPWPMDEPVPHEYHDPAEPALPRAAGRLPDCGPHYLLRLSRRGDRGRSGGRAAGRQRCCVTARSSRSRVSAAITSRATPGNAEAVAALRERKFRKEKTLRADGAGPRGRARRSAELTLEAEALLTGRGPADRPGPGRGGAAGRGARQRRAGVMLPYTPLHHLLFAAGAPDVLVMTSANRSSEPIAYEDEDALTRLVGHRRRVPGRRAPDRAPGGRLRGASRRAWAGDPPPRPRLRARRGGCDPVDRADPRVGADLKKHVTLVVDGQAFVSQHIGDLDDYPAVPRLRGDDRRSARDVRRGRGRPAAWCMMPSGVPLDRARARARRAAKLRAFSTTGRTSPRCSPSGAPGAPRVLGVSLDGTGYGDDGTIWGGEFFVGSVVEGFERVAHLRPAALVGGDAAARHPVQAAAGFLAQVDDCHDLDAGPFGFPGRYRRCAAAARERDPRLLDDFGRPAVRHRRGAARLHATGDLRRPGGDLARAARPQGFICGVPMPFRSEVGSWTSVRCSARWWTTASLVAMSREIARAFHAGVAHGLRDASCSICRAYGLDTVVASGGVFQNRLLLEELQRLLDSEGLELWTNRAVPPNDGGISLGQAALAALERTPCTSSPSR